MRKTEGMKMSDTNGAKQPASSVQVRVPADTRAVLEDQGFKAGDVLSRFAGLSPEQRALLMTPGNAPSIDTVLAEMASPVKRVAQPAVSMPAVSQPVDTGPVSQPSRKVTQAEQRAAASRHAVRVASVAAVAVAVASGVLSVRASAAFAVSSGVTEADWSRWLFPVAIEGSMVAAAVVLWSRHGNRVLGWAAMAGGSLLAIAANVAHNPDATTTGKWFSAVPPVATVAMVELVASIRARNPRS